MQAADWSRNVRIIDDEIERKPARYDQSMIGAVGHVTHALLHDVPVEIDVILRNGARGRELDDKPG